MTKIITESQYNAAMERVEELLKVVDDTTPADNKDSVELVLLSNLVADYEEEHFPIKNPSLTEILKLRMFEMGLTQTTLARKLGMSQSKISEIIAGKVEPTLKQARRISIELDIAPAIVLGVWKNSTLIIQPPSDKDWRAWSVPRNPTSATPIDNLCFVLKNLSTFTERPKGLEGELYDLLFSSTEISKFAPRERKEYYRDMTTKKDIANQIAFAEKMGVEKIAKNMLEDGLSIEQISKYTGLTAEQISALK